MTYADALKRLAGCRAVQPTELQVIVSADIVDAILAGGEVCPVCVEATRVEPQPGPRIACGRGLAPPLRHGWIVCARPYGHAGLCSASPQNDEGAP